MTEAIMVRMSPAMKRLIAGLADKQGLPMSELVVQLLAKQLRKPDLSEVPRKRMGRPRKALQTA